MPGYMGELVQVEGEVYVQAWRNWCGGGGGRGRGETDKVVTGAGWVRRVVD